VSELGRNQRMKETSILANLLIDSHFVWIAEFDNLLIGISVKRRMSYEREKNKKLRRKRSIAEATKKTGK
jgi:hypothetical protein